MYYSDSKNVIGLEKCWEGLVVDPGACLGICDDYFSSSVSGSVSGCELF